MVTGAAKTRYELVQACTRLAHEPGRASHRILGPNSHSLALNHFPNSSSNTTSYNNVWYKTENSWGPTTNGCQHICWLSV